MMVLCFAAMSLALVSVRLGPRWLALTALAAALALSARLFLTEIHGPDDGFRMPWLQG